MPRLYDVTGGRVTLDGVDVRDLDFDTLPERSASSSQGAYLFHASVADNLRFAKPDATAEEIETAARAAQIHDHIASPARRLRHPGRRAGSTASPAARSSASPSPARSAPTLRC
ncbi:hypothetical protein SCALM49S_04202 [Streptomyces californicus]